MPSLIPQSALFQPIAWQGQQYFTSQYFHRQYHTNHPDGKHKRLDNFMRLITSMETYQDHLALKNIVVLTWDDVKSLTSKSELVNDYKYLQSVFQATGYRPLTLLNATAQVALSHHLDDELSKQLSVATNTSAARQLTSRSKGILPEEHAARAFAAHLQIAALLGCPVHVGQQEAVKLVHEATGLDYRPLLHAAPAQRDIKPEEEMLEPKDLAKQLGIPSGAALNKALEHIGWQVKQIGGGWEPTPTGTPYSSRNAWTSDHSTKSGYNYRWQIAATAAALKAAGYEFPVPKELHP